MVIERIVQPPDAQTQKRELSRYPEPDFVVSDLTVELFQFLHNEHKINFAIFDLDNTLTGSSGRKDVDEASRQAILQSRANGFLKEYGILSNIQGDVPFIKPLTRRVEYYAQLFETKFYHAAIAPITKPHPRAFQTVLDMMGAKPAGTVVIGDQLGKDILGARNIGALAVLHFPPIGKDPFYRKGKREKEQAIIAGFSRTAIP